MTSVLIADDDVTTAMVFETALASMGYQVVGLAYSGIDAVQMAKDLRPDIILMDIVMPGEINGITAAGEIKEKLGIPFIFLTGHAGKDLVERAKKVEPYGYIMKPAVDTQIRSAIEIALHKKKEADQLREAKNVLEDAVQEKSRRLRDVTDKIEALLNATSDTQLLIDAEGTVIMANEVAAKRFGMQLEEFLGRCVYDFMSPSLVKSRKAVAEKVLQTGKPVQIEDDREGIIFESVVYPLLDEEGKVSHLAVYGKDITERVMTYRKLEEQKRNLGRKTDQLRDANIALEILLEKSNQNRKMIEEEIAFSAKRLLSPYIQKLKACSLPGTAKDCAERIDEGLNMLISPFSRKLSFDYLDLTPREIQVANFIIAGKTTKEISKELDLTTGTIDFHRNNMRKKLGLKKKKISLRTYLNTLEH